MTCFSLCWHVLTCSPVALQLTAQQPHGEEGMNIHKCTGGTKELIAAWSSKWTEGDEGCEAGAAGALADSTDQLDALRRSSWPPATTVIRRAESCHII